MTASEQQIVVVFDVSAPDRLAAAKALSFTLSREGLCDALRDMVEARDPAGQTALESWWFPEADLKQVDRNDNGAFELVPTDQVLALMRKGLEDSDTGHRNAAYWALRDLMQLLDPTATEAASC